MRRPNQRALSTMPAQKDAQREGGGVRSNWWEGEGVKEEEGRRDGGEGVDQYL
jgi:hypothetical protein